MNNAAQEAWKKIAGSMIHVQVYNVYPVGKSIVHVDMEILDGPQISERISVEINVEE